MPMTLLPTGKLEVPNQSGSTSEIGSYRKTLRGTLLGLGMIAIGAGGWWYNWHLAASTGQFYIKLCILGPLGVFGGILAALRPDWAGPVRSNSSRAHKTAMFAVLGLMAIGSGIDFYLLKHGQSRQSSSAPRPLRLYTASVAAAPVITFMSKKYRLGSYNQKKHPTWEFIAADENINDWSSLLTIIDRPDASTRPELDRLAEGIMSTYKDHGGASSSRQNDAERIRGRVQLHDGRFRRTSQTTI